MCFGGPGPGGSAAAIASGPPGSAVGPGATTGVGGSIPGGIDAGIGTGGMSMSTGLGVPGAGEGSGGLGDYGGGWTPASLGPGFEGQPSGWGSSDVVNWGNLALGILTGFFPALAPFTGAAATATMPLSFEDMHISRPIPEESPETIANQSGSMGQPTALPSVSTPTPAPASAEAAPPAVDNTAYNKTIMDQYIASILNMPSGGGRGIRGAGLPGYKQEQQKTAEEWLSKYWRE